MDNLKNQKDKNIKQVIEQQLKIEIKIFYNQ